MISKQNYEILKEKYGFVSSWTIWKKAGRTPKSNTEDMSWIYAPDLLSKLNTGYVFVGLNASSTHGEQNGHWNIPWSGFHSGYTYQHDYKLRYALVNTRYWGSYITDVIKNYPEVDSGKVRSYLHQHPEVVIKNIKEFEKEISYLGPKPILVALGVDAYDILKEHLVNKYTIVHIKHFSCAIGSEDYRREVLEALDKTQPCPMPVDDSNSDRNIEIKVKECQQLGFDSFPIGCRILHNSIGKGTVISRGNGKITVKFDKGRIEDLNVEFCLKRKKLKLI